MSDELILLTAAQIVKLTGLGKDLVALATKRGDLKSLLKPPANRTRLYRRTDVDAWIATFTAG